MVSKSATRVGVDSNCLSYIIDTMKCVSEPMGALACEKRALFRIYLYLPDTLYVTPTVLTQCADIPDANRHEMHSHFCNVMFKEVAVKQEDQVRILAANYGAYHSGADDCRILAEAVHGGLDVLLTYDYDFISRLRAQVNGLNLQSPSSFWESMNIPRGAKPDKLPRPSNPLSTEMWWRW